MVLMMVWLVPTGRKGVLLNKANICQPHLVPALDEGKQSIRNVLWRSGKVFNFVNFYKKTQCRGGREDLIIGKNKTREGLTSPLVPSHLAAFYNTQGIQSQFSVTMAIDV